MRRGEVTSSQPEAAARRMRSSASSLKGRQLQVCVSLPPDYVRRLKVLSQATHESMAHYFREALRDLFAKHDLGQRTTRGRRGGA